MNDHSLSVIAGKMLNIEAGCNYFIDGMMVDDISIAPTRRVSGTIYVPENSIDKFIEDIIPIIKSMEKAIDDHLANYQPVTFNQFTIIYVKSAQRLTTSYPQTNVRRLISMGAERGLARFHWQVIGTSQKNITVQ